jgi:hypothetical protein
MSTDLNIRKVKCNNLYIAMHILFFHNVRFFVILYLYET